MNIPACSGGGAASRVALPQTRNPAKEIPEVRVWAGRTPLVMGVDSACSLPVVVFPEVASRCHGGGPCRDGYATAPVQVSWARGHNPIVAYSHVVSSIHAPLQGLVGWPVARHFVWHLELSRNRHEFTGSLPPGVQGLDSLPLREASVAKVDLPGCGECILDTGAPYGLYLSQSEWRRFLATHPHAGVGLYIGSSPAAGGAFCRHYTWVDHLQLGPWRLRNIRVCESFSPRTGPRLLGREALAQFDLWVDGPSRRLYYRPLP